MHGVNEVNEVYHLSVELLWTTNFKLSTKVMRYFDPVGAVGSGGHLVWAPKALVT